MYTKKDMFLQLAVSIHNIWNKFYCFVQISIFLSFSCCCEYVCMFVCMYVCVVCSFLWYSNLDRRGYLYLKLNSLKTHMIIYNNIQINGVKNTQLMKNSNYKNKQSIVVDKNVKIMMIKTPACRYQKSKGKIEFDVKSDIVIVLH